MMFLVIGLVVVCAGIGGFLYLNNGAHLQLDGEILKVRVLALNSNASLVVADFRVTNPSDVPFVVRTVRMFVDDTEGSSVSKADVDNVFKYEKLIGPKYNDVLTIRDRISPHKMVDRMVGARFEMRESGIKKVHLRIEEVDGTVAEIAEKK